MNWPNAKRAVEGVTFARGLRLQFGEKRLSQKVRRLAEGLGGDVENALDGLIGGRAVALYRKLQKGHQVAYLAPRVKAHRPLQDIRDAVFDKRFFQRA